jgi:hypothetical protein
MSYRLFQKIQLAEVFASLEWPGMNAGMINPVILDFNGDGQLDFAFHVWQGQDGKDWGIVTDEPTLNKLIFFESQPDGTYKENKSFLIVDAASESSLPGMSRKVAIADINQDGRPDWVYALNREDGRAGSVSEYNISEAAAVISQPNGTYQIVEFGEANWYHSVYVDQYLYGTPLVILAGYYHGPNFGSQSDGFVLGGGLGFSWSVEKNIFEDGIPLPAHPNTFTSLISPSGSTQFITVMNALNGTQLLGLFEKQGNAWVNLDALTPYKSAMVDFVSYSLDRGRAELFEMGDGTYATAGGYSESGKISLYPGDESTSVFKFSAAQIDSPRSDGYYYQNDGVATQRFDFYRSSGETLNKLEVRIINEDTQLNINFFDILDFNNDGLQDIAAYPYVEGGQPRVYLNTGGNIFYKIDNSTFPTAPSEWGLAASSKFADINSDGIFDLLYAPMNGFSLYAPDQLNWLTYLGNQVFDAHIISTDISISDRLGSNKILTWSGNDTVEDIGASATVTNIDLGDGVDKIKYSGSKTDYALSLSGLAFQVLAKDSTVSDLLLNVERLDFADANIAIDTDGVAGEAYRIYKAAFDRAPDLPGLGYWINDMDKGASLETVASGFIASDEFLSRYGSKSSNVEFIRLLYENVLDRQPDSAGYEYWQRDMANGMTREKMLINFSESNENKQNVAGLIESGIEYTPFIS